ncbi:FkbM family methyltransferase [Acidianus manzaensis]|nr:FkbM family methyltransferase [Acidianus manzaensis]
MDKLNKILMRLLTLGFRSTNILTYYTLLAKLGIDYLKNGNKKQGYLFDLAKDLCEKNINFKVYGVKLSLEPCFWPPLYSLFISTSEPVSFKYFLEFVKDGGVVVDVGANVGIYSLIAAKYAERVFAIEANPEIIPILNYNITLNDFKNVTVINKAVSDSEGKVKLYLGKAHEVSSILPSFMEGYTYSKYVEVESTTLDNLLSGVSVNLLKIDVEGAEVNVLRGAKETLKKAKRIIIEVRNNTEQKVLDILKQNNFEIVTIEEGTKNIIAEKSES